MAGSALKIALAGYDVQWWHLAVAFVVGVGALAGGFFAVRALRPVVARWSLTQQLAGAAAVVLVVAGAAFGIYKAVDRPGDVINEDVEFEPREEKKKVVETVKWPVYGFDDQRTRYLPSERVNPPYRGSDWSFQAGKLLEFSPIVIGKSLYVIDKDALLYSLDAGNGKANWKRKVGALSASSPAYADGRLFAVTLEPGDIQALHPRTGKVLWERELPGRSESSPLVYADKVIVGTEVGTVFALDVKDGSVEWTVDTADAVKGGVALDQGIAYFGNYAGELYAVRASNGDVKWQTGTQGASFGVAGRIYSTPAIAFGRVYVGSVDNRVYSFDQDSGELAWSHSTGDWVYAAPAVAEVPGAPATVYIGGIDQNFYALDARTGRVRWQHHVGGPVIGAASVIGDTVYVGVIGPKNGTIGFDADSGKQVFEHELGEYNPAVSDGARLYLTGSSGIRAFTPDTGPGKAKEGKRSKRDGAGHR